MNLYDFKVYMTDFFYLLDKLYSVLITTGICEFFPTPPWKVKNVTFAQHMNLYGFKVYMTDFLFAL